MLGWLWYVGASGTLSEIVGLASFALAAFATLIPGFWSRHALWLAAVLGVALGVMSPRAALLGMVLAVPLFIVLTSRAWHALQNWIVKESGTRA